MSYSTGEHSASTNSRHRIRFWASAFTSVQVFLSLLASSTTVLFHVVFGRPLLRVPCGFQSSAVFAISPTGLLMVWPIQFHFWRLITVFICSQLVILYSSSFLIVTGHRTFSMRLRHRLTKTWIWFSILAVIFQVSQPYSNTETQLLLKIWFSGFLSIVLISKCCWAKWRLGALFGFGC